VTRTIHPIETESYQILRSRTDTATLPPLTRAVVERVIHASADLDYRADLVCDEGSLRAACEALANGAPIVCDVAMVAAGITAREARTWLDSPHIPHLTREYGITRSAAGIRLAVAEVGAGAVWVIGNAPTALFELLTLADRASPALVIGLPVGFVGAAESKAALRASGLPAVSNVSEKGGSAVAAAALNALLYKGVAL
jgi:precorrin-8X/cobalt-precorrin-8 methylmutase